MNWDLAWVGIKCNLQKEKPRQTEIYSRCEKAEELQRKRIVVKTDHSDEVAATLKPK